MLRSLKFKTIMWTSIPVVTLLLVVAGVTPRLLEEMSRTVAQQRDVELARISSARLSEKLSYYSAMLQTIAASQAVRSMHTNEFEAAVRSQPGLSDLFDGGIAVFDSHGLAVWGTPEHADPKRLVFPATAKFEEIRKTLRPIYSDLFKDPVTAEDVVMIGVPIVGAGGEFTGVLAGMASAKYSSLGSTYHKLLELKGGRSGHAYLVDGSGRAIYHRDLSLVGENLQNEMPVREVIARRTGAAVVKDAAGEIVIVGYAPVPETGWGLVTQETWDLIISPIRHDRVLLLCLLVAGGMVANGLMLVGVARILRPIRDLTDSASRIARGDFDHKIVAETGDEVQVLAEQFNGMAGALKKSYSELEQRVAERTRDLAAAKEKAEDAERVKSAFLATMSHELRTPLNSMIGFTGMVLQGVSGSLNAEQSKQLKKAYRNAQQLLSLINNILDLSKIDAGKMTVTVSDVDVGRLIRKTAETMAQSASEKGISLSATLPPEPVTLPTDERRLEQILLNLLSNAVKFTDRGSVTVSARRTGGFMEIIVEDTGIGIEEADFDKLFKTFDQLDSARTGKREGTGLGLAICDKLAALLGGTIKVESAKGKGSKFTVALPLSGPPLSA